VSVTKRVPLWTEKQYVQVRGEFFTAWNQTQFSSYDSGARYDATGRQVNPNFGAYTAARDPRIIQLSAKIVS
jgi:hypothetical protein